METSKGYKNKKQMKQFRWNTSMERVMLQILAEEVRKGNKPSNVFKSGSYVLASRAISEKFGVSCLPEHVENHLKTVKKMWSVISTLKNRSGFEWDEKQKMIIVSSDEFDEEITVHPSHERYLNRKIELYDEMNLVVGKDTATGRFAKSFLDIDINDLHASSSNLEDCEIEEGEKAQDVTPIRDVQSQANSAKKRKQKSMYTADDFVEKISGAILELASAIKESRKSPLDVDLLYEEVMGVEGFDRHALSLVFDYLGENEKAAAVFLAKDSDLKRYWVENYLANIGHQE